MDPSNQEQLEALSDTIAKAVGKDPFLCIIFHPKLKYKTVLACDIDKDVALEAFLSMAADIKAGKIS
jgi:hypothetical protein